MQTFLLNFFLKFLNCFLQIDRASYCGGTSLDEIKMCMDTLISKPLGALFTLTGATTKKTTNDAADGADEEFKYRSFNTTVLYNCIVGKKILIL